ncbi:ABC transporter permease [Corynebacterium mendelii]|uniref:ABC transporter permease n=1 Tax=Corynebacterium mendelii TaxID=2765362 RepID=A0A939DZ10_9CORY|nr:ABC transporter permease [Corynebacterium mendelii]MBN9643451.1 ABC transporter permease [Corynebacterium mendelii]
MTDHRAPTRPHRGTGRFPANTFTPDPARAPIGRMIAHQARIESLLFLRHGEQQLLSLIIPFLLLVSLTVVPVVDLDNPVDYVFPLTMAISAMSAGFTGQAIAVAFDRRYGALKRIGASGVPAWAIITGKVMGVWGVSVVQTLILGATALVLGWRQPPLHVLLGLVVLVIGVACFTALGLLLGGTLSSEIVLALANLIWFLLAGAAGFALITSGGQVAVWYHIVPSIALAEGTFTALNGQVPWLDAAILVIWTILGALAANRWFSFTMK